MQKIPEGLDSLEARTPEGTAIALTSLWSDQPVLLVLVRQFG